MLKELTGYTVAILVANGFEESEMVKPRQAFDDAGAKTVLISPERIPYAHGYMAIGQKITK